MVITLDLLTKASQVPATLHVMNKLSVSIPHMSGSHFNTWEEGLVEDLSKEDNISFPIHCRCTDLWITGVVGLGSTKLMSTL